MMLTFLLLVISTLPQKGEQQLIWKQEDRKASIGDRLVIQCYGSQLPPSRTIDEVLVQRNYSGVTKVLSHCLRSKDTCVNHEAGIFVHPKTNFSNFGININFIRLSHIGDYACEYYSSLYGMLGTEWTNVDVQVPPDALNLFVDGDIIPINRSSIAVTSGKSTSFTCSAHSRPAVELFWVYPKWLLSTHNESQDILSNYLTEVNSTVTFTMTSMLKGKTIRCMTSPADDLNVTPHRSVELEVLDPPNSLSVSLFVQREESVGNGDILKIKVKEKYNLLCSMLSKTVNRTHPHWSIPSNMDSEESFSSKIYPYHEDFTVSTIRLYFEGKWTLHQTSLECTALAENKLYRIKLMIEVEGFYQRQSFLIASVVIGAFILVLVCCLLIYLTKRRISMLAEVHHIYLRSKESSMTASFRRSLPPVPHFALKRTIRDQSSKSLYTSHSNLYEAIGGAEEEGRLDIIPYRDICFTLELSTSRNNRRWLGSFTSDGNTKEVLITCLHDNSDPKLELLWQSYVALILRLPAHENIMSIFGISYFNDLIYVIQDYIATITLRYHLQTEYLNKIENQTTLSLLLKYTRDILNGMVFLAQRKCCHPGLSAQKILVNSQKTCKLYDFCAANDATDVLESYNLMEDHDVFPSLPPESLLLGEYTTASDVWSIGVTLWEILSCGEAPFPNVTLNELEGMLRKGQRLERPADVPCEIFEIVQSCWSRRSQRRPTVTVLRRKLETVTSSILTKEKQDDDVASVGGKEVLGDVTFENTRSDVQEDHIYQRYLSCE